MVDINNLNRIRGILSARQGAEIPKFQNPARPLVETKAAPYAKFAKKHGDIFIYSGDEKSWFLDPQLTKPANINNTAIPGANPDQDNPNAAVEASAAQNAATQQVQQQNAAQTQALQAPIPVTQLPIAGVNGTTPEVLQKIEVPEAVKSAVTQINTENAQKSLKQKDKEQKKEEFKKFVGQASVATMNILDSTVGAKQAITDSNTTKTVDTVYDGIAGAVENMGPVGKVVGTAMKYAGIAGDTIQAMGGGTDQQTKMDQWMDSSFFSWNIGMLNGFAGKNTQDFGVDQDILASVGSSYGGTASDLNDAADKAGKKYGLFSSKARKKADAVINGAKAKQNLMGNISDTASDQRLSVQSMGEQAGIAYSMMTDGGYNQKYTYAAKHGGLLEWNPVIELEWKPQIELNQELPTFKEGGNLEFFEELEQIPEFKEGGKTKESDIPEIEETTQKNVIPEGALHKNKHHMEHAEGLTKKGIPVIDEEGEQQAEIEHSEIIFTLEVTKKLEEYYEIFYSESASNKEKEQAALETGKLLVYQILENTEDRTGLIESCKKGGTLNFKKSTEDLIEEALEWIPTITIIEQVIEEEKEEKKSKNKSEKEQMKEAIKEVLIELLTK